MFSKALFISESYIDSYKWNPDYYSSEYIELEKKVNKDLCRLGEVTEEVTNGPHGGVNYVSGEDGEAVPYLRAQNLEDGIINNKNLVYISKQDHESHIRAEVVPGDIVLTITGVRVGEAAIVPRIFQKANIIQSLAKLKIKKNLIDEYYLLAYLNSNVGRRFSYRQTSTTAQAGLNFDAIKNIQLYLPSRNIQNYIGNKVRKVEQLREEGKKLKEEAELLYNQSVGNLVSVKRMVKRVNEFEVTNDTWFPAFYDSLEIGKNSSLQFTPFIKLQKSIKCGDPIKKEDREGNTYPFYGASGITDSIDRFNFDGNYLIIAQDGTIGSVSVSKGKFWANNHVWVVEIKPEWNISFLKMYLEKYPYWYSITTGSVVPKITSENLKKILVPEVDKKIQDAIGNNLEKASVKFIEANALIQQAKIDVESLIEGTFDESIIIEVE